MFLGWFGGGEPPVSPPRARSLARAPSVRRRTTAGLTPAQILSHLTKSGQFHLGRFKTAYVMDGTVLGQGTFGCVRRCFSAHAPDQGEKPSILASEEDAPQWWSYRYIASLPYPRWHYVLKRV